MKGTREKERESGEGLENTCGGKGDYRGGPENTGHCHRQEVSSRRNESVA